MTVTELEVPEINDTRLEEALEKAYWVFDAKCKGYKPYPNKGAFSDRDNFKMTVRGMIHELRS